MNDHMKSHLSDIAFSAGNVMEFIAERTFEEYLEDIYFRSAVERQLELMADTVGELLRSAPEYGKKITQARRIVDFRNRLAHGYRTLINPIVWDIAQEYVAPLKAEVEALLARSEDPDD